MKVTAGILAGAMLLALLVSSLVPASAQAEEDWIGRALRSIGRLYIEEERLCTVFVTGSREIVYRGRYSAGGVIYAIQLVTAGHCVFEGEGRVAQEFRVTLGNRQFTNVFLRGVSGPEDWDAAVLEVRESNPLPALILAPEEELYIGQKLFQVGYGRGALMMRTVVLTAFDERGSLVLDGVAGPGNSGGPVLIPGTRKVVAIGVETTRDIPKGYTPLMCAIMACPHKSPFYAAPVRNIFGIIRP